MSPDRRAVLQTLGGVAAVLAFRTGAAQPTALHSRPIPATGERLPVIGLGTWQVFDVGGDAARRAPLREVLSAFARAGAKLVDSSAMYGTSESVLGDLAAELKLHRQLFLATKVWTSGRDEGLRQMELSFARLRAKRLDLMQVHNLVDVATHTRSIEELKAKQRVRYLGITHYVASAYSEIERLLKTGRYEFVQVNYSLAEPEAAARVLPLAAERGVAVIANRPFAQGAMFRRVRGRPLPEWASELGAASWAQFFLKWIVSHPAVTCAIPGTSRPEHMLDNLAAGLGPLPDEPLRRRMAEHFAAL
jgi:diketogulonate reductase-like aldo/keto reductase